MQALNKKSRLDQPAFFMPKNFVPFPANDLTA